MKKFEFKSLDETLKLKSEKDLNYSDLLSTTEWRVFRSSIIKRDNGKCQKCGEIPNELAWELKGDFYVRQATDDEKELLGYGVIYSSKKVTLNVHHKYYIKNKYPWQYKLEALITVCSDCHLKIHQVEDILIYDNESFENPEVVERCLKCSGTGYIEQYNYFMDGICFECNGKGILE
ncbi:MAG TPA: hypothetical protein VLY87_07890 [Flavobacterium sp.]|nr:hypothetical protein [Flavobacterium sp.]